MAKFSERIDFVKVETIENKKGIREQVEVVEYSCWCNILSRSMSEIAKAYTTNTELLYSFRTRYCRFTKALELDTRTCKIKYRGKYFNIISANDYGMAHLYIDVKAVRVHDE